MYVDHGSAVLTGTQVYRNSARFGRGVHVGFGSAALIGTQVYYDSPMNADTCFSL